MTEQEIKECIGFINTEKSKTGYKILINGETFVTRNGKSFWNRKNYAMCAFRNAIESKIENVVRIKLLLSGVKAYDVYKYGEYKNAYNDFLKYLKDNNLIELKEVK